MSARKASETTFPERAYALYGKALHRYLTRRLLNADSARDLAQEAYLRLLSIQHHELIRAPQAYLFRIASNLIYESCQHERRSVVTFDSRLVNHVSHRLRDPAVREPSEMINTEQELEQMLADLPELHAAILVMKQRDGLSMREIARALNISIHTVKKYLFRATSRARSQFRDHDVSEVQPGRKGRSWEAYGKNKTSGKSYEKEISEEKGRYATDRIDCHYFPRQMRGREAHEDCQRPARAKTRNPQAVGPRRLRNA